MSSSQNPVLISIIRIIQDCFRNQNLCWLLKLRDPKKQILSFGIDSLIKSIKGQKMFSHLFHYLLNINSMNLNNNRALFNRRGKKNEGERKTNNSMKWQRKKLKEVFENCNVSFTLHIIIQNII
ncbi:predicted protein [Methanosarcina acetivorans C2A]|uniref:Uncharacterized protein n=1 Tax=Methanosarcina acetivorans (strain ATCC 35395 / DSM 2834 / JCM 12185 / C2A) TaxID=188937 RepID=Q8TRQ8_METAC|nr:predicted protein [Methanosarcina acetivorans C2A]